LYFDNFPHGHYGTIRQQIWSLLHFPFQLAIVGVVEGSQQLALARYTIKNMHKVGKDLTQWCNTDGMTGDKLREKLVYLLNYFELDTKIETLTFYKEANNIIYDIGNSTGICINANEEDWPEQFYDLSSVISNGMYVGLGMKIPAKKLEEGKVEPLDIAIDSWELVYMYYWGCFCLLIACLIIFLFLIRRHKVDLFDFTSIISRFIVLGVGGALLGLYADKDRLFAVLETPMLLPTCVILLLLILVTDKLSSMWCNWRLKKSGQPYALEVEHHEHEHHHAAHGEVHERAPLQGHGHGHHDSIQSNLEDARKSARWSTYSDTTPLTAASTEYNAHGGGYAMEPLMSPPLLSPPLMSPDPTTPGLGAKPSGAGGYMPVSSGQNFGA
jgi:hypothetical protein